MGAAMIRLYTWARPNGYKISILLEELELPYEVVLIDVDNGAQFDPDYLRISPNGKIPALYDPDGPDGQPITLFESGLILLYLADKTVRFLPAGGHARFEVLKWLFWQVGGEGPWIGLYFMFRAMLKDDPASPVLAKMEGDALQRLAVLEKRLEESRFVGGPEFSIADISCYLHTRRALTNLKAEGKLPATPNLDRWISTVDARPAVQRGAQVPAQADWVTGNGIEGWQARLAEPAPWRR